MFRLQSENDQFDLVQLEKGEREILVRKVLLENAGRNWQMKRKEKGKVRAREE